MNQDDNFKSVVLELKISLNIFQLSKHKVLQFVFQFFIRHMNRRFQSRSALTYVVGQAISFSLNFSINVTIQKAFDLSAWWIWQHIAMNFRMMRRDTSTAKLAQKSHHSRRHLSKRILLRPDTPYNKKHSQAHPFYASISSCMVTPLLLVVTWLLSMCSSCL